MNLKWIDLKGFNDVSDGDLNFLINGLDNCEYIRIAGSYITDYSVKKCIDKLKKLQYLLLDNNLSLQGCERKYR